MKLSVIEKFDQAAPRYELLAKEQLHIATRLIEFITSPEKAPRRILDIGCGTGFAARQAHRRWPTADIIGLDHSSAMLQQAQNQNPFLKTQLGNAAHFPSLEPYDLIVSSMALHWLPDPLEALRHWRTHLNPTHGSLYVSLPIKNSFQEWETLCRAENVPTNLWPLPDNNFATSIVQRHQTEELVSLYPSTLEFLRRIKSIGASTSPKEHPPATLTQMRRLLKAGPQPFLSTYRILYMEIQSEGKL